MKFFPLGVGLKVVASELETTDIVDPVVAPEPNHHGCAYPPGERGDSNELSCSKHCVPMIWKQSMLLYSVFKLLVRLSVKPCWLRIWS